MFSQLAPGQSFAVIIAAIMLVGFVGIGIIDALKARGQRKHERILKHMELTNPQPTTDVLTADVYDTGAVLPTIEERTHRPFTRPIKDNPQA